MSFVDGTKMLRRSYRRLRATEEPRSRVPALARHSSLRHAPGIVMEVTAAERESIQRAAAFSLVHQVGHRCGNPSGVNWAVLKLRKPPTRGMFFFSLKWSLSIPCWRCLVT